MITKIQVHEKLVEILDKKIASLKMDIDSSIESRNSATKSTAGDKHETARAMLQAELEYNELQLQKTLKNRYDLMQLKPDAATTSIQYGSLVFTTLGTFYISIGLGKFNVESELVFAISPASPLGKSLLNKSVSHKVPVNNTELAILDFL